MKRNGKANLLLVYSLIIISMLIISSNGVADQGDSFSEIEEKMDEISDEKKVVLENLFTLVQELEEMGREEEAITQEIETINDEIKEMEAKIHNEEVVYEEKRDVLKEVLKSYQRKGPGSYLEIILDSENLSMFLRRINILRDLTRNTGELLASLDESRKTLTLDKTKMAEKLTLMEDKKKYLRVSLSNKLKSKDDMENYLASLEEERAYYQDHLTNITQAWDELRPLFSETIKGFSRIIEEGDFPPDTLKTTFSFFSIKGSIDEDKFNNIIEGHPLLPEMIFSFQSSKMTMTMPKENLVLVGDFVVLEEHSLKFEVEEGSFYGMALEAESIEDLFKEGYLMLNLKPLLGKSTLSSVKIEEGYIELTIIPKLF